MRQFVVVTDHKFDPASMPLPQHESSISHRLQEIEGEYWHQIDNLTEEFIQQFEHLSGASCERGPEFLQDVTRLAGDWFSVHLKPSMRSPYRRQSIAVASRVAARIAQGLSVDSEKIETDLATRLNHFLSGDERLDRRQLFRAGGIGKSWGDAASWIAITAASGVAGNITYDALKHAWRGVARMIRDDAQSSERSREDDALTYLVKLAVVEQCRRYDFPVPSPRELQVQGWQPSPTATTATLACRRHGLSATVSVPYRNIEESGVQVTVHRPARNG